MTRATKVVTMMMRTNRFILVFIVIWAFPMSILKAQPTDFRMRFSAKVKKELTKKLSGSIEYEHRFDQMLTSFDKAILEPSLSYNISKPIRIGAEYRIMLDQNKTREQTIEQRIAAYVRYKFEIDDFEIQLKTAIQYGFDELTNSSFSYNQKLTNRNSIALDYNWFGEKITPFVSYEFFYHINHPNGGIINQSRIKAGSSYQLSKNSKIQIFYLFENEFNIAYPVDAHIIGAGYSYVF